MIQQQSLEELCFVFMWETEFVSVENEYLVEETPTQCVENMNWFLLFIIKFRINEMNWRKNF